MVWKARDKRQPSLVTGAGALAAIAQWSARIRALSRGQRWLVLAAIVAAWLATHEGMLILLLLVAPLTTLGAKPASRGDAMAVGQ